MMNYYSLTINQAAEYVNVGRHTLRNLIREKKIPCITVGPKELILVKDLELFMSLNRGQDLLNIAELQPVSGAEEPGASPVY